MEIARMNYRFTAILILMLTALAFCATPAYPRNEYLNDGNTRCGEVDLSVSNRDYEYDNYDRSWNESNSQELRLTFRNPSLAQNENFALLVSKCRGVVPEVDEVETMPTGSLWDELKDDYIKANPDSKSMDNNNSTLKMPPEGYILPKPKPKDE